MNWFYKLKSQVRIIIAIAMWVLLFIVAGLIGNSMGENDEIKGWQAIIILVLLAVATAVTVFTIIAQVKEVKATKMAKQAEDEKVAKAKAETEQSEKRTKLNVNVSATLQRNNFPTYSDTPEYVVTLISNSNEDMQDNISCCSVGDEVNIEEDWDKDLYLCSVKNLEIGFLPKKFNDKLKDNIYDIHSVIDGIDMNDNDKYVVKVAIYEPKSEIHFPIRTKVVGVSFEDRQDCIKASKEHDLLTIRHTPLAEYPEASLIINDRTGKTLGSVRKELAQDLLNNLGKGFILCGEIDEITGGSDGKEYVGCNIIIKSIKQ